jgi:hypothetical protein
MRIAECGMWIAECGMENAARLRAWRARGVAVAAGCGGNPES